MRWNDYATGLEEWRERYWLTDETCAYCEQVGLDVEVTEYSNPSRYIQKWECDKCGEENEVHGDYWDD